MKLGEVPAGSWVLLNGLRLRRTGIEAGIGMVQLSPDPQDLRFMSTKNAEAYLHERRVSGRPRLSIQPTPRWSWQTDHTTALRRSEG